MTSYSIVASPTVLVGSLDNQVLDNVVRLIDMSQRAAAQSMSIPVIFFFLDVAMRTVKKFERSPISACVSKMRIHRWVVVQVLPVVDRSTLDFSNGLVDLRDGMFLLPIHPLGGRHAFQVGASMAQVGERVQIGRMSSRFVCKGQRGAERNQECEYGTMS
jgi:hypothetical protein